MLLALLGVVLFCFLGAVAYFLDVWNHRSEFPGYAIEQFFKVMDRLSAAWPAVVVLATPVLLRTMKRKLESAKKIGIYEAHERNMVAMGTKIVEKESSRRSK